MPTKEHVKRSKSLSDALQQLRSQLPYLPQTLKLVWQAARWWSLASISLLIAQGLLPVAAVYLTRSVVNGLVEIQRNQSSLTPLIITISLYAL
ncbi:MAG: hypothetical protein J7J71_07600, partial [Deltaproteobacteria bacterium]|nr:hypothetical protein [Candidatus Tharpella sp.]